MKIINNAGGLNFKASFESDEAAPSVIKNSHKRITKFYDFIESERGQARLAALPDDVVIKLELVPTAKGRGGEKVVPYLFINPTGDKDSRTYKRIVRLEQIGKINDPRTTMCNLRKMNNNFDMWFDRVELYLGKILDVNG